MGSLTELADVPTLPKSHLSSKVRVIVRLRPFLPSEISARGGNSAPCISAQVQDCDSGEEVVVHLKDNESRRKECYKLDSFFGQENNTVTQIFQKEVTPLINGIFCGFNATVFAYGATGSGKTYTMQGSEELPGLMPLAMSRVLSMCKSTGSSAEISYYEVYMDRCFDLLEPKAEEISLLEDKDGQLQLRGLSRIPVSSMFEFHQIFASGIQRRKVAHTSLNDVSSRSHGVLVISICSASGDDSKGLFKGKLNLIDLAGNEDNRRTCNEGIRLQESTKINQSLFALSNVICALNNNDARVPYRESKLTRILQDSLGGMSNCMMVVCLNPGEYDESVRTVKLAARSRQISNFSSDKKQATPKEKVSMEEKLHAWLESKGKTKSVHRTGALCSPFSIKSPGSISSMKRAKPHQTPAKGKVASIQSESAFKERSLCYSGEKDESCTGYKDHSSSILDDDESRITKDENCNDCSNITPSLVTNKQELLLQDMGLKTVEECVEGSDAARSKLSVLESYTVPVESMDKEKKTAMPSLNTVGSSPNRKALANDDNIKASIPSTNSLGSPSTNDRIKELQDSIRKVLSPINTNIKTKTFEDLSSKDRVCLVFFEPKTPKAPSPISYDTNGVQTSHTPLNKFNARTSNLKSSLVHEYLAFLNTASREELLELKGIGQKRADYIIQIRETSPFKSLCDLEKMGLSSKQAHDIFRRAAREIL